MNSHLIAAAKEFSDWWDRRGRDLEAAHEVRQPLFHYTDMAGLLGIITTEQMWFTSMFHLNDPSELSYGINLATEALEEQAKASDHIVETFCRWTHHVLVKSGGEIFGFYVASFSQAGNDLSQWRAYADNGRGVALGLAPSLFKVAHDSAAVAVAEKTLVANVSYNPDEVRKNMAEAIQRAATLLAREHRDRHVHSAAEAEKFGKQLAGHLAVSILTYAITCKHPAYANEQETRLLIVNDLAKLDPITLTRRRGSSLIPYIASPLRVRQPGAITKIMIGPSAEDMADDAVRAFLRQQGLPSDIVEPSDIPYQAR